MFKGRGIKSKLNKFFVGLLKKSLEPGFIYNTPKKVVSLKKWLSYQNNNEKLYLIREAEFRQESPPVIINHVISNRFSRYYNRTIPPSYIIELRNGKVIGDSTNFIVSEDNKLLSEISREFGAEGGKKMEESSLIEERLNIRGLKYINGKVAVISTCGYDNFHHWNFDCISRLQLLREAGIFHEVDFFIITYSGQPFQLESLNLLNVPKEKIINPLQTGTFFYQAKQLFVPSLPSELGTITPWVVDFLDKLYNPIQIKEKKFEKIYLSRKKVKSRNIFNNADFEKLLTIFGFKEIFPEDYSVTALAKILSGAFFIISVHGSGLANLCFISPGTIVIDILAPSHQDCYYWMICNCRSSKYIGFFSEGIHPKDDVDIVKNKIDNDFFVDLQKMRQLLTREMQTV